MSMAHDTAAVSAAAATVVTGATPKLPSTVTSTSASSHFDRKAEVLDQLSMVVPPEHTSYRVDMAWYVAISLKFPDAWTVENNAAELSKAENLLVQYDIKVSSRPVASLKGHNHHEQSRDSTAGHAGTAGVAIGSATDSGADPMVESTANYNVTPAHTMKPEDVGSAPSHLSRGQDKNSDHAEHNHGGGAAGHGAGFIDFDKSQLPVDHPDDENRRRGGSGTIRVDSELADAVKNDAVKNDAVKNDGRHMGHIIMMDGYRRDGDGSDHAYNVSGQRVSSSTSSGNFNQRIVSSDGKAKIGLSDSTLNVMADAAQRHKAQHHADLFGGDTRDTTWVFPNEHRASGEGNTDRHCSTTSRHPNESRRRPMPSMTPEKRGWSPMPQHTSSIDAALVMFRGHHPPWEGRLRAQQRPSSATAYGRAGNVTSHPLPYHTGRADAASVLQLSNATSSVAKGGVTSSSVVTESSKTSYGGARTSLRTRDRPSSASAASARSVASTAASNRTKCTITSKATTKVRVTTNKTSKISNERIKDVVKTSQQSRSQGSSLRSSTGIYASQPASSVSNAHATGRRMSGQLQGRAGIVSSGGRQAESARSHDSQSSGIELRTHRTLYNSMSVGTTGTGDSHLDDSDDQRHHGHRDDRVPDESVSAHDTVKHSDKGEQKIVTRVAPRWSKLISGPDRPKDVSLELEPDIRRSRLVVARGHEVEIVKPALL